MPAKGTGSGTRVSSSEIADHANTRLFFEENGYLGPYTLFAPDEMASLWKEIRIRVLDQRNVAYPGSKMNYDRHLDLKLLSDIVSNTKVTDLVSAVLGSQPEPGSGRPEVKDSLSELSGQHLGTRPVPEPLGDCGNGVVGHLEERQQIHGHAHITQRVVYAIDIRQDLVGPDDFDHSRHRRQYALHREKLGDQPGRRTQPGWGVLRPGYAQS